MQPKHCVYGKFLTGFIVTGKMSLFYIIFILFIKYLIYICTYIHFLTNCYRFYEITKLRNQFQNILETCNMKTCKPSDELSSSERARRHGEVRMLKAIKRKQKYQEPRKRKILKHNTEQTADDMDIENQDDDIRDIDFRLHNDNAKLEVFY